MIIDYACREIGLIKCSLDSIEEILFFREAADAAVTSGWLVTGTGAQSAGADKREGKKGSWLVVGMGSFSS